MSKVVRALSLIALLVVGCGSSAEEAGIEQAAMATPAARPAYLALGDSIAFGYNLNHRTYFPDGTSKNLPDQSAYAVGYPEALGRVLANDFGVRLPIANTACPGEASGSLITGERADDNDCFENRHEFALHHEYDHEDNAHGSGKSQLEHAIEYIAVDPSHVKLITLTVGANDALKYAGDACLVCIAAGALDAVLFKLQRNWETILEAIVATGYKGPIVGVLYYSPGYRLTHLPQQAGIRIINAKIHDAAKVVRAKHPTMRLELVESFDVFNEASRPFGGDACAAGLTMLMTKGPDVGSCDAHASNLGQEKLARAVWQALSLEEQTALLESGTKH